MVSGCTRSSGTRALIGTVALAAIVLGFATPALAQPAQQPRVVFHEMFTATWCVYCPSVRAIQSQLFNQNPNIYFPIQVHGSDPWTYTWGTQRINFYAVDGYPTTVQDGILKRIGAYAQSQYVTDFNARKTVPTDVTVVLSGQQISGLTYRFTANVGLIPTGAAKTVRVYMAQTLDDYPHDPQYPQYDGDERNCFIQVPALNPTQDFALTPGSVFSMTRDITFSGDSASHLNNVRVVAWAQKISAFPAEVYQSAYTTYPFFADCNGNGIADPNEMAACNGEPWCSDCNGNGIMDSCDIAGCGSASCHDCNNNGVPDSCEFTIADCDNNGLADACEIAMGLKSDCNNNGIPDSCDVASFSSLDCNTNGIPDECDLAACAGTPWCADCNHNGKIDACDLYANFAQTSPNKSPIGTGYPQSYTIAQAPGAVNDVTFNFWAKGDFSAASEYCSVYINGTWIGDLWVNNGVDCADLTASLTMTAAAYNAARQAGNGDVTILMSPSAAVAPNPPSCPNDTYIRVKVAYFGTATSQDNNGNGIPDECEGPALCHGDMNCDGNIDFADIDPFVLSLSGQEAYNAQFPNCQWLNGDANGDNTVDFADIDAFVGLLFTACP